MDRLYGCVCYAGIDTDPELKYPKGAGRVAFSSQHSYISAISARFVQLQHGEIDKRVMTTIFCVILSDFYHFFLFKRIILSNFINQKKYPYNDESDSLCVVMPRPIKIKKLE